MISVNNMYPAMSILGPNSIYIWYKVNFICDYYHFCICFLFYSTMSVITESESHSTLTTAVSMTDIQSDTMDNKGESTPYPREKISDEHIPYHM